MFLSTKVGKSDYLREPEPQRMGEANASGRFFRKYKRLPNCHIERALVNLEVHVLAYRKGLLIQIEVVCFEVEVPYNIFPTFSPLDAAHSGSASTLREGAKFPHCSPSPPSLTCFSF